MPKIRNIDADLQGDFSALYEMARRLVDQGEGDKALALVEASAEQESNGAIARAIARAITSRRVLSFHKKMLRDQARNRAYGEAISQARMAGKKVIEIGAGSGLLSILSAKAGAREVVACEVDPMVAETARKIVQENGVSDRVRIITGRSTELAAECFGEPADIVVSEIFDADLVGENLLASIRDAHERLIKPGAKFIPSKANAVIALVDDPPKRGQNFSSIEGVDLSAFERHFRPRRWGRRGEELELRSDPARVAKLDLSDPSSLLPRTQHLTLESKGGRVSAIVQWIEIDFGNGTTYQNAPGQAPDAHWDVIISDLDQPVSTKAGDPIDLLSWLGEDILLVTAK